MIVGLKCSLHLSSPPFLPRTVAVCAAERQFLLYDFTRGHYRRRKPLLSRRARAISAFFFDGWTKSPCW